MSHALDKMSKSNICFYLCVLVLHSLVHYSHGYRNIRPQDYLCADKLFLTLQKPFRGSPTLTLTEDRDSAAIITQMWNKTLPGQHGSKIRHDCEFRVQTPEKPRRGIYTIITRLKFRKHHETGACIDYIQFESGNRSPSERICNEISIDGPAGRLIFDERDREVTVHIHIDKQRIVEPLELNMVLTAHSECRYDGDFQCDPKDGYSCISQYFVRDNITNCMFPCRDEASCFHDAITAEEIDTTNVAISAITSLIFTMLGVGVCVWICWKYWNCITVQQQAHEESAAANRRTTQMDFPPNYASAPVIDEVVSTTQAVTPQTPKDLPPSYESLFPDR